MFKEKVQQIIFCLVGIIGINACVLMRAYAMILKSPEKNTDAAKPNLRTPVMRPPELADAYFLKDLASYPLLTGKDSDSLLLRTVFDDESSPAPNNS
ncbi:MAG: hypothetical protein LBQ08_02005 [Holosporaceae bacterium]|nr:hypothetical protein [Holosporaceae bacterium]